MKFVKALVFLHLLFLVSAFAEEETAKEEKLDPVETTASESEEGSESKENSESKSASEDGSVKEEDDVMVLNTKNFDRTIESHDVILVEFYAPWYVLARRPEVWCA